MTKKPLTKTNQKTSKPQKKSNQQQRGEKMEEKNVVMQQTRRRSRSHTLPVEQGILLQKNT